MPSPLSGLLRVLCALALSLSALSSQAAYWSVFNIEEESVLSANIVTYTSLGDMLGDTNRTGVFIPNPNGFGRNIVGGGSDEMRVNQPPVSAPAPGTLVLVMGGLAALALRRRGPA